MVQSTLGMSPQMSIKTLLEAGVHFGHQTKRWNPKMKPYIFADRNGIHIIDLQQTVKYLEEAHNFVSDLTARGGRVLMVGTKKQAQEVVQREAERSGQFYINRRWLGGTLTNFVTIRNRLRHMKDLQRQYERGEFNNLPKKEAASKLAELERLERTLGGVRDMTQLPGAVFVIDPKREHLAVHEAKRLGIPIIGITDTNCDPDDVDLIIPGNDDAIRSVRLITAGIADAALQGRMELEVTQADQEGDAGAPEEAERPAKVDVPSPPPAAEAPSAEAKAPTESAAPKVPPATETTESPADPSAQAEEQAEAKAEA